MYTKPGGKMMQRLFWTTKFHIGNCKFGNTCFFSNLQWLKFLYIEKNFQQEILPGGGYQHFIAQFIFLIKLVTSWHINCV